MKLKTLIISTLVLLSSSSMASAYMEIPTENYQDPSLGGKNAPVLMEIFDDYQCPFCAKLHKDVLNNQKISEYIANGKLMIMWKDFPLSFHKNAFVASQAVNAVNKINPDKFASFSKLLFENQAIWGNADDPMSIFVGYTNQIGIDRQSFEKYAGDENNTNEINQDTEEANLRGITGTPTSFINGKTINGAQPIESILKEIEIALDNQRYNDSYLPFEGQPPIVEESWPLEENPFYFIYNVIEEGEGKISVSWDKNFAEGITKFETLYDIYDLNGNYISGSMPYTVNANTSTYYFPYDPNLDTNEAHEILVTVNAYNQYGFLGSDYISHHTGILPIDSETEYAYEMEYAKISHDRGPYYSVDLSVGEQITFYAHTKPYQNEELDYIVWQEFPSEKLNCKPANTAKIFTCTAIQSGEASVNFIASNQNDTFSIPSPAINLYIHEDFANDCPEYTPPLCPNGVVYYPPQPNGCFGHPICQEIGKNIAEPTQGYEDEVITNIRDTVFSDTDINKLSGKAADELYRRGVIGGFPDGEFKGDRPVNRAEAAKFLLLAKQISLKQNLKNPFWDVIETEWYGPYVINAAEEGIIEGHPDSSFKPGEGILTSEFIAMMARTFGLPENLPHSYKDAAKDPSAWFWKYAGIAEQFNLFPDRIDYLNPVKPLTRNEVAVAIYQYLKKR